MKTKKTKLTKIESGDYTSRASVKGAKTMVDTRKKQLINLPDDQKEWILKVVQIATERGQDCNQTVIIRILVGNAMKEAPEQFVERLTTLQRAARLADIERKFAALQEEKERLAKELEGDAVGATK